MYFVDRNKITLNLNHMNELIAVLEENTDWLHS